ncbi:MAG TPA: ABC transporter permease [Candidatus Acidoferrales bacterium]|nr:ABC transporter permease [Candidatus Acidoferrales bacterium]
MSEEATKIQESGYSQWSTYVKTLKEFGRVYKRNKMGMIGLVILTAFIIAAIFAPYIAPYDPAQVFMGQNLRAPSWQHPFGTNEAGQDLFSQVIYGTQASLIVGFAASLVASTVGTLIGVLAGYFPGLPRELLMRLTDFFIVIPSLVLMIVLASVLGAGLSSIILAIGLVGWTGTARVVMSQTLSVRERAFVEASRASGAGDSYILRSHVLPNVMPVVFANTVLVVANSILYESVLTFLGLGNPNQVTWGQILQFAFTSGAITTAWWYVIPPGLSIMLVVLAFSLTGYSLDEIFNPRVRKI